MANRLALELVADANPLLKSLEQSQRQLNNFIRSSESAGQVLGGGVNRALDIFTGLAKGGGAAAGVLAGGFVAASVSAIALVEHAGKQAEALEQLSQKTGISTGTIQQWSVIMAQSGLGAETLTRGVKQLSEQIIQARNPNSQAAETFSELGITATSVNGVIEQVADHFVGMADGADKTRLAVTLFGKAGQDLIPTLNLGSAGFRESMEASKQLGTVLSESTLHALSSADDAFDRLGVVTSAASNQLAGVLAPAVTTVTNLLTEGVSVVARYFQALNEGVSKTNSSSSGFSKWAEILKAVIAPTIVTIPQHLLAAKEKMDEIANRTEDIGVLADAHVQDLLRQGAIQEDMGRRILVDLLGKWRLITAEQRAQESLGRSVNALAERERQERNAAFALQLQQQEDLNNQQFGSATPSAAMQAHEAAVENLIRLMPELNHHEAAFLALKNADEAHDTIRTSIDAYRDRNKELELGVEYARADFQQQQSWYQQAPGLIGQAEAARQKGFELLQAENDLRRQMIDETIFDEERKGAAILALDVDLNAKRRGIIQQFPTFWEKQLSAVVASNAFSISAIMSSFNQATAMWVQGKGTFDEFIQQTQNTLIQSTLQATEIWLDELVRAQLIELGLLKTQEAAKTAAAASGSTARLAIAQAEETGMGGILSGMSAAFEGMVGVVKAVTLDMATSIIEALITTWTVTKAVLGSIAAALKATVFGVPVGLMITAALVAGSIMVMEASKAAGIALGALAAGTFALTVLPFASGGIVTGPTMGMMGEAGSPEAAIPLNDRGAKFMQRTMGLAGGNGRQTIIVQIDKREIARAVFDGMPAVVYARTGLA